MLIELPELLRARGIDADAVLRACKLEPTALQNAEGFIPFERFAALCCATVDATGDDHFLMAVGALARPHHLGLLGELMSVAPTLNVAIDDLVGNHPRYVQGGGPYLLDLDGDHTMVGYRVHMQGLPGKRHIARAAVAFGYSIFESISGAAPEFVHVSLPGPADEAAYRSIFPRAKMIFDSPHYGLVYPKQLLHKSLPGANIQRRAELERAVQQMWLIKQPDMREQVLRVLVPAVFSGAHNLTTTARRLGMGPRALNAALKTRGTSFRDTLNEARLEMASQLLIDTHLTMQELATLLGYSEISAFTRFFTRMTGVAPAHWRRTQARDGDPD
ncbi:MAG: AraC family transcriptional regulator ligand-binding domain-containing protein [Hyphomicrobiales bacterium]